MHVEPLEWTDDHANPLVQQYCFSDPVANSAVVGTGYATRGQALPTPGPSFGRMREVIIVLDGALCAERGEERQVLKPGDTASALLHERPRLHALEDSKFLFIRFGRRLMPGSDAEG